MRCNENLFVVNVQKCVNTAGRLMALGEIGAQYEGIAPNDPRLEPIFALAEELDIPVSIHVGLTKPGVNIGRRITVSHLSSSVIGYTSRIRIILGKR